MQMTSYPPGTPSWVDLGTPDLDAAADFYGALFGWTCDPGPEEFGGYRMCLLRGSPVAGMGPQGNPDMPPWWTTYISVASADDAAAAIEAAGGTLMVPPMDVMDVGRMAVAADPAGALFSVWEPRSHPGAGLVNEPGTLCWNELTTRRPDESIAFYGTVFGWTSSTSTDPMPYTEFQLDGRGIGGMMAMDGSWPADLPNHWMVYFAVADTDASAARCVELGGATVVPPTDIPPGRFAVLNDPAGALFSIIQFTQPI
jgi:uncharacterized protein